jgi:hypothetical protein
MCDFEYDYEELPLVEPEGEPAKVVVQVPARRARK